MLEKSGEVVGKEGKPLASAMAPLVLFTSLGLGERSLLTGDRRPRQGEVRLTNI